MIPHLGKGGKGLRGEFHKCEPAARDPGQEDKAKRRENPLRHRHFFFFFIPQNSIIIGSKGEGRLVDLGDAVKMRRLPFLVPDSFEQQVECLFIDLAFA